MSYDEEYYRSGNYANYMERGPRYGKLVEELDDLFKKLCIKEANTAILDFGCALGYVVEAFLKRGYERSVGFDISEFAVRVGNERIGNEVLYTNKSVLGRSNDITLVLDVFEHMQIAEIQDVLLNLHSKYIIFRAPVSTKNGGPLHLEISQRDPTHITRLTKFQWSKLFSEYGFERQFNLNLYTMYDSEGVLCAIFRRHVETDSDLKQGIVRVAR